MLHVRAPDWIPSTASSPECRPPHLPQHHVGKQHPGYHWAQPNTHTHPKKNSSSFKKSIQVKNEMIPEWKEKSENQETWLRSWARGSTRGEALVLYRLLLLQLLFESLAPQLVSQALPGVTPEHRARNSP